MGSEVDNQSRSDRRRDEGNDRQTLSGREILFVMTIIALAVVGGYFLILKLIDVSRQDDCVLANRRNCGPAEPFRR
jgi:hypothetical protein